jgi:2-polyprenyl-3-methyl-5-hydroxy-6-metoxy-1,4-benzoquinol methylase
MNCRFCKSKVTHPFIDLVNSPPSNSFLKVEELNLPEVFYPLKVYVCDQCFLVQVDEYKKSDDIFNSEYVYFSSFSTSWLKHSESYVEMMNKRFNLNANSLAVEVASNDGYLLQYFKKSGVKVLGIEPTANTAAVAAEKGIESIVDFFGVRLASELVAKGVKADVLLGNNVLAHVPDINDFVGGLKILLNNDGVITMEFPHLLQLIQHNQFDTIYHEHFSYLSLLTVQQIFNKQGLSIFDVEEISTHGGSLRIFAAHTDDLSKVVSPSLNKVLNKELTFGLDNLDTYSNFQAKANQVKNDFLLFLLQAKKENKKVAAYGAAAKGNTLLNYCGIKSDLISFVVDANPAKQNKYLPGIHIPVFNEQYLKNERPDYVIILPWNIKHEVIEQLKYIKEWGGHFVTAIPKLQIV